MDAGVIGLTRLCVRHVRYEAQDEPLDYLFVSIEDDTGEVGHGEACDCFGYHRPMVAASVVRCIVSELTQDPVDASSPRRREPWSRGPIATHARAVVANALLDLIGRRRLQPAAVVLGGDAHREQRIYASAVTLMHGSSRSRATQADEWLGRGAVGVKVRLGDELPTEIVHLRDLRRSLGDGVTIMADANEKLSAVDAAHTIDVLGELDVRWIEEPVDAIAWTSLAAMRRSTMPIAFGEHLRTLDEFDALVARAPFDILQTDASISGGIIAALPIVNAAARCGLRVVAHNAAGPLAFAANLHLAAVNSAVELLEYPFPVVPFWRAVAPEAAFGDVRDGVVAVGDEPGLGVTIDLEVLDRATVARDTLDLDVTLDESAVLSGACG